MRLRIEITTGTGFDADGKPLAIDVAHAREICLRRAADLFGGCTVLATDGAWFGDNREYVRESGLCFVALADGGASRTNLQNAGILADEIKTAFRQNCVVLTLTEVDTEFI